MDLGLNGRVYVLTGASRGLGYATAQSLAADGARVVISSRDRESITAAAASLNAAYSPTAGGQAASVGRHEAPAGDLAPHGLVEAGLQPDAAPGIAVGIPADLADPETPARLVKAAVETFGRFDGALISVGGPPAGTAAQATDEQWRQSFESVFLGAVRAARVFAGGLGEGGAIGLVLSSSAKSPVPGLGISNGLRPGLLGAAKDLADEFGPKGIRVLSLLPGRIQTARLMEIFAASGDAGQAQRDAEGSIPLGRIGDPAEFGRVAAFLLSPAASYVTGNSVSVDGGMTRVI
jgi:3-oxoacyl-[acyl-carrier protein] reductase